MMYSLSSKAYKVVGSNYDGSLIVKYFHGNRNRNRQRALQYVVSSYCNNLLVKLGKGNKVK